MNESQYGPQAKSMDFATASLSVPAGYGDDRMRVVAAARKIRRRGAMADPRAELKRYMEDDLEEGPVDLLGYWKVRRNLLIYIYILNVLFRGRVDASRC